MKYTIALLQLSLCLAWLVANGEAKFVGNVKDDDEKGTISVVDIQDDNKTQYYNQNFEQGNYNYGYDIKPSGPVGQFHHENKAPDNVVYGCYGYETANNQNQMTFYISDAWGYRPVRQEESTEVFYPADNPEGTTQMKGTLTRWVDLVFPDMCAQFAERIASSSNVVTKAPIHQQAPGSPFGATLQTPLQPHTAAPVTGPPTAAGLVYTNSPVPLGSFDVIHLSEPTGSSSATPVRFTISDDAKTPGSPTSLSTNEQPGNLGIIPGHPGSTPPNLLNSNAPNGQISSTQQHFQFGTPSASRPPSAPATTNRNPPHFKGSSLTTPSVPDTRNTSPDFLADTQSSNVGPLFPNRPAGGTTTGQNQITFSTQLPINVNNNIRKSTVAPPAPLHTVSGPRRPVTSASSRPGQGFTGNTGGVPPSLHPSSHVTPSGSSVPTVPNNENEVPVGASASKTVTNEALLSTVPAGNTPGNPLGGHNPYDVEDDDSPANPNSPNAINRNPAFGTNTRTPLGEGGNNNRRPSNSGITRGPASSTRLPASQGGVTSTTPQLSTAQGSTTLLHQNRAPVTGGPPTLGQTTLTGPNTLISQGTRRPTATSSLPVDKTQPTTSFNTEPSSPSFGTPTGRPATGSSTNFHLPSTPHPSGVHGQQNGPSQFSQKPDVHGTFDLTPPEDQEHGVVEESTSTGLRNPTNRPGASTQPANHNRFTPDIFSHASPAIPVEPDTDTNQPQISTQPSGSFSGNGFGNAPSQISALPDSFTGGSPQPDAQRPHPGGHAKQATQRPFAGGSTQQVTQRPSSSVGSNQQTQQQPFSGSPAATTNAFINRRPGTPPPRSPTSSSTFSTRAPTTSSNVQLPLTNTFNTPPNATDNNNNNNNNNNNGDKSEEFCATECSSCKSNKEPVQDDDFLQIPGAILANIPVIYYPDCSANAYSRPAIVPFCPSQKSGCGEQPSLTMKFPDAANFVINQDAPVARNAFVSRNHQHSSRVARKVKRGRQQRILRS